MTAIRHVLTHWITSASGLALTGLEYYVAHPVGPSKYVLLATALLGLWAKDPNKT